MNRVEVSRSARSTSYACLGVCTATVVAVSGRWQARCYYEPGAFDTHERPTRDAAEKLALSHTLAITR